MLQCPWLSGFIICYNIFIPSQNRHFAFIFWEYGGGPCWKAET
jgi:hypothetical protein